MFLEIYKASIGTDQHYLRVFELTVTRWKNWVNIFRIQKNTRETRKMNGTLLVNNLNSRYN